MKKSFTAKQRLIRFIFNNHRKNRYKIGGSPLEVLRAQKQKIDEGVLNLPPIILDRHLPLFSKGGYVPSNSVKDCFTETWQNSHDAL